MGGAASSPSPVRVPGILVGLADAWRLRESEADSRFVSELHRCFAPPAAPAAAFSTAAAIAKAAAATANAAPVRGHPSYMKPRLGAAQRFGVRHYAGDVFYEVGGFCAKNRESLSDELHRLLSAKELSWLGHGERASGAISGGEIGSAAGGGGGGGGGRGGGGGGGGGAAGRGDGGGVARRTAPRRRSAVPATFSGSRCF